MKTVKELLEAHFSRRGRDSSRSRMFKDQRDDEKDIMRDEHAGLPPEEKPGYLKTRWTTPQPPTPEELARRTKK